MLKEVIATTTKTLAILGLMSLAAMGGAATQTKVALSVQIGSHDAMAAQERQIEVLASKIEMPKPQRKPVRQ